MNQEEAKKALIQASRIIDQWEKNELESYEAMEMIAPLLKTIAAYLDLEPAAAGEKKSDEDLKAGLEEEKLEDLETYEPESQEEDLFSKKSEDLEEEKDDESKSKSKKRKEFAGSNGEIPF